MTTTTDGRGATSFASTIIQPELFNAEAPAEALTGVITPTDLYYVRSNFALRRAMAPWLWGNDERCESR
jgi:hypothetical protein